MSLERALTGTPAATLTFCSSVKSSMLVQAANSARRGRWMAAWLDSQQCAWRKQRRSTGVTFHAAKAWHWTTFAAPLNSPSVHQSAPVRRTSTRRGRPIETARLRWAGTWAGPECSPSPAGSICSSAAHAARRVDAFRLHEALPHLSSLIRCKAGYGDTDVKPSKPASPIYLQALI
jgi:hypothetical protein